MSKERENYITHLYETFRMGLHDNHDVWFHFYKTSFIRNQIVHGSNLHSIIIYCALEI